MMSHALLLGLLQGVTEFLPISSSGHLLVLHGLFGEVANSLSFDAVLHLATALALVIYFRNDWLEMIVRWHRESRLRLVVISSIPAVFAGLLLEHYIEDALRSPLVVVVMLVFIGSLMWYAEKRWLNEGSIAGLNLKSGLLIGLAQAVALIPGTSRSGITIITGMRQGLSRKEAARFSFLLGAPITFGAGLIKFPDLLTQVAHGEASMNAILAAFLVSFVAGLISIRWLLSYLENSSLRVFTIYRFLLASLVLLVFYF